MSYCRATSKDSDVYVVETHDGWECVGCSRAPREESVLGSDLKIKGSCFCTTRREMVEHLLGHRLLGNKVPLRALVRLEQEILQTSIWGYQATEDEDRLSLKLQGLVLEVANEEAYYFAACDLRDAALELEATVEVLTKELNSVKINSARIQSQDGKIIERLEYALAGKDRYGN